MRYTNRHFTYLLTYMTELKLILFLLLLLMLLLRPSINRTISCITSTVHVGRCIFLNGNQQCDNAKKTINHDNLYDSRGLEQNKKTKKHVSVNPVLPHCEAIHLLKKWESSVLGQYCSCHQWQISQSESFPLGRYVTTD